MPNINIDSQMFQLIVQVIGFFALLFSLLLFQVNNRKDMLKLKTLGAVSYTIHFFLLGAYTGSAMNMISVGRDTVFIKAKGRKRSWALPGFFIVVFVGVGLLTWQGPISLLPITGMITGTIAFWQRKSKSIRWISLLSPPMWFIYNAVSGSYAGMLTEVILLSSDLTGIYRFDIHHIRRQTNRIRIKRQVTD